jgi:spoIIIJ-associated protein
LRRFLHKVQIDMDQRRSIEVTGESIQEAIDKGLAELGAKPNEVIVEVLEEPSRGVFGLGARPAKVRLQVLFMRPAAPPPPPPAPAPAPAEPEKRSEAQESRPPREPRGERRGNRERDKREREPRGRRDQERPYRPSRDVMPELYLDDVEDDDSLPIVDDGVEIPDAELSDDVKVSKEVLTELLERMAIEARVAVRKVETTRESENTPWLLNVVGADLNVLIGRRGETLASLQYITRLIASRRLEHRANIIVDVDNYKARRSQMLRGLANRMADQAVQQKRTITLEPMPPHERRIIHLTLRERADVSTRSVGEGDARKVTIVPKQA